MTLRQELAELKAEAATARGGSRAGQRVSWVRRLMRDAAQRTQSVAVLNLLFSTAQLASIMHSCCWHRWIVPHQHTTPPPAFSWSLPWCVPLATRPPLERRSCGGSWRPLRRRAGSSWSGRRGRAARMRGVLPLLCRRLARYRWRVGAAVAYARQVEQAVLPHVQNNHLLSSAHDAHCHREKKALQARADDLAAQLEVAHQRHTAELQASVATCRTSC